MKMGMKNFCCQLLYRMRKMLNGSTNQIHINVFLEENVVLTAVSLGKPFLSFSILLGKPLGYNL